MIAAIGAGFGGAVPVIVAGVVILLIGGLMGSAGGKKLQDAAQGGLAQAAMEQVLEEAEYRPGAHISCVGADMPGKQELASALVARAAVYVDDREQSVASGELEIPVAEGAITPEDIKAELGEVIAGAATGRSDDEQVTVFDTSGIAVQDLSASKIAYDRAVEAGLGTVVEL